MNNCKHKWVDVPKGESLSYQDQVCIYCGIKQMQAAAVIPLTESIALPLKREVETFMINTPNGKLSVNKEDLIKELHRSQGLLIEPWRAGWK